MSAQQCYSAKLDLVHQAKSAGKKCVVVYLDLEYKLFLRALPLLHVRKHKIPILFSAYKDGGLVQLLCYMRDDEEDWKKIISVVHIEMATQHNQRLSVTLHIAFLITFIRMLPT